MPLSLRHIDKIFWCLYIHAGVTLQPIFRLHKASCQAVLRVHCAHELQRGEGRTFLNHSWLCECTKERRIFWFLQNVDRTNRFLKRAQGIKQISWKFSFKLNLCLNFCTCLTSHVRCSMTIGNLKFFWFRPFLKFLSMTNGVFTAIIFLKKCFFRPAGGQFKSCV